MIGHLYTQQNDHNNKSSYQLQLQSCNKIIDYIPRGVHYLINFTFSH